MTSRAGAFTSTNVRLAPPRAARRRNHALAPWRSSSVCFSAATSKCFSALFSTTVPFSPLPRPSRRVQNPPFPDPEPGSSVHVCTCANFPCFSLTPRFPGSQSERSIRDLPRFCVPTSLAKFRLLRCERLHSTSQQTDLTLLDFKLCLKRE